MTIWEPRNKLMTSLSSYFAFSTEQITAAVPKRESRFVRDEISMVCSENNL